MGLRRSGLLEVVEKPLEQTITVCEAALALGYSPKHYSAIAITDGSGSNWKKPVGSAARLYIAGSQEELLLTSRASNGTNQLAELQAVLIAVQYLHGVNKHLSKEGCKLLVVTDNSLVEQTIKQIAEDPAKLYTEASHCDQVAALLAFARRGFRFSVHRIGRNTTPVHAGVDEASRSSRLNTDPEAAYVAALQKALLKNGKKESSSETSVPERRTIKIKRRIVRHQSDGGTEQAQ